MLTLSNLGSWRKLTIPGALKDCPPPPYDLENYCMNRHPEMPVHLFMRWFTHVPVEFLKNSQFCPFSIDFKLKNIKN